VKNVFLDVMQEEKEKLGKQIESALPLVD